MNKNVFTLFSSIILLALLNKAISRISQQQRFTTFINSLEKVRGKFASDKIIFKYDEKKGFFCEADSSLNEGEYSFVIDKDNFFCSNHIIPYLEELTQGIDVKLESIWNDNKLSTTDFLDKQEFKRILFFAYTTHFALVYPKIKEQVKTYMRTQPKNYISRQMELYLEQLPEHQLSFLTLDPSHYSLLKDYSHYPINYRKVFIEAVEKVEEHLSNHAKKGFFNLWVAGSKNNILELSSSILQRGIKIRRELFESIYPDYLKTLRATGMHMNTLRDINFHNGTAYCFINYVDLCNFPTLDSSKLENDVLLRADYSDGNLLVYNRKKDEQRSEYNFVYEKGQNTYQAFLRYGYIDKANINSFVKVYFDIPTNSLSETISSSLSLLDSRYQTNLKYEFTEITKSLNSFPFLLSNNRETHFHLRKLIRDMNNWNSTSLNHTLQLTAALNTMFNSSLEFNKQLDKTTSYLLFESWYIKSIPMSSIENLASLIQRVKNQIKSHKEGSELHNHLTGTEKVLSFILSQRLIIYKNQKLNLEIANEHLLKELSDVKRLQLSRR